MGVKPLQEDIFSTGGFSLLRFATALTSTALVAVMTTASGAAADVRAGIATTESSVLENTGFSSENVEWLGINPRHTGSSGGMLLGKHYYMTDPRGLYIYDVSDAESPQLVGEMPVAVQSSTHTVFAQEDPDTNGKLLLLNALHQDGGASANGDLLVVDVSDKSSPQVIGSLNVYDHTWTCILNCKYAIGRTGHVVDLRDPANPERVADWREHVFQPGYMHDFVEVAPGRVIGSGQPSLYLDMRNPLKPRELARFDPGFHTLGYHGAQWPNKANDPLLLMGAEVAPQSPNQAGSDCTDEGVHAVATYDASQVLKVDRKQFGPNAPKGKAVGIERQRAKANFRKLEEWRVEGRGVYADGNAPGHTLYCGHWFDAHPKWRAGGILAVGHYDWGTRFLKVSKNGKMEQIGYFQPILGHTASARWITNEIVYVHDYRRGLEILRFTD